MRLLVDTHALLWWLLGDSALSPAAQAALADSGNDVLVSAASAWEISTKHKLGRLPAAAFLAADLGRIIAEHGFGELPITVNNGLSAGSLPLLHKDPFDRMLIAQALAANLVLVSNEKLFDDYGVARLW